MASNTWKRSTCKEKSGGGERKGGSGDTLIPDGVPSVLWTIKRMAMEQRGGEGMLGGTSGRESHGIRNNYAYTGRAVQSDRA